MSNCLFGWPNYSDVWGSQTPTFTGGIGSWQSALPLTNMQDRRLAKVARSTDATAANTAFEVDLKTARGIGCLALTGHNLTASATVRWRGGASSGAYTYDSTALAVSWSATTAEDRLGVNCPAVHIPTAVQSFRFWRCDVSDTGNPAGYVEIGRLVVAARFQPTINISYGASLSWEDDSTRLVSDGGAALYNVRSKRRGITAVLDNIAEAEALGTLEKMQHQAGTTGQVFFVWDTADTTYLHERAFLACFRQLSALEAPYVSRYRAAFSLVEEL
jgi:hypothetical protein